MSAGGPERLAGMQRGNGTAGGPASRPQVDRPSVEAQAGSFLEITQEAGMASGDQ